MDTEIEGIKADCLEKYRSMVLRGLCPHAATASVINYAVMKYRDEGLSLDDSFIIARQLLGEIKTIWEE